MKLNRTMWKMIMLGLALLAIFGLAAYADEVTVPPVVPTSWSGLETSLLGLAALVISLLVGRFIQALRAGQGLKGAIAAIWLGTNGPAAKLLVLGFGLALLLGATGCEAQKKYTKNADPFQAAVVSTYRGTVVYPSGYFSVTNGAGAVQVYPVYSAVVNTNPPPFSLWGFIAGGDAALTAYSDRPVEIHEGGGRALLVDAQYSQLTSDFSGGPRFGGNSQLAVGAISLTVNTNAITATGNAGNQLLQGLGASVGNILSNAKK